MKNVKNVYAPSGGVVSLFAYEKSSSYGNMIVIDHGAGIYSLLAHMKEYNQAIKTGDKVESGDYLGIIGNTSVYEMPIHLHWSVFTGLTDIWNKDPGAAAMFSGQPYRVNRKQFAIDPEVMIRKGWEYPAIGKITSPWGHRSWPGMNPIFAFHYGIDFSGKTLRKKGA